MSMQPLTPIRKDLWIILEALDVLSDQLQNEIDTRREKIYLSPSFLPEEEAAISALNARLEEAALTRGRLQPYLEDIYDEESSSESISFSSEENVLANHISDESLVPKIAEGMLQELDEDAAFAELFKNATWEQFIK